MYEEQLDLFSFERERFRFTKPIRLIETFAGIGSQYKSLLRLGLDVTPYRMIEIDEAAVKSYNAMYGTNFTTTDITKVHAEDLGIEKTWKYDYVLTYSFPCTDLSTANTAQRGLSKEDWLNGNSSRSGLLWEIERILDECKELPQVLLLENVPQLVKSEKNLKEYQKWMSKLESLGYTNYTKIMMATEYGYPEPLPQRRERVFCVSILKQGSRELKYEFPPKRPLKTTVKDFLEENPDESLYLSDKTITYILDMNDVAKNGGIDISKVKINPDIAKTISCRGAVDQRGNITNFVVDDCPPITCGELRKKIEDGEKYRIRKLSSLELWRLMGFDDEDHNKAAKVTKKTQLIKQAGNSICVNVLSAIFKEMI